MKKYIFSFPTALESREKKLVYTDEVKKEVEKEKAIMLMMALVKKRIPFSIHSQETGGKVKAEEIIPREEFWKAYFARNLSGKEAEEILLR